MANFVKHSLIFLLHLHVIFVKFSLSPLDLPINTMECVLHITYRLQLETWSVKVDRAKTIMNDEKKRIQHWLEEKLGIHVDLLAQGSGNTNSGNTARRFFGEPSKSSAITRVHPTLIHRFSVILFALTSSYDINTEKYKEYAEKTEDLCVRLY